MQLRVDSSFLCNVSSFTQAKLEDIARSTGRTQSKTLLKSSTITPDLEAEQHFNTVAAYFLRPLGETGHMSRASVVQAEYIVNPQLLLKYEKTRDQFRAQGRPLEERFGFHGTSPHVIDKIFEEGFKIGGPDVRKQHGSAYGTGVYLATTPTISKGYTDHG